MKPILFTLITSLLIASMLHAQSQDDSTDTTSTKSKFKTHFYKGADNYISASFGFNIPRKDFGDIDKTGADYGMIARLDAVFMFAEYFGIGLQIPYYYNGNNKSAHNFSPAYKSFTSDGWRGGGFMLGAAISVPVYPIYVDMKFYPGYLKMNLPNTEAILTENQVDNVYVQESVSDGGFAFSISGGIRYPITEKFHIGIYVGNNNMGMSETITGVCRKQ